MVSERSPAILWVRKLSAFMQQSDRTKRYSAREQRKQTQWPPQPEQDTLSATVAARHKEIGDTMEERREGDPPRNERRNGDRDRGEELLERMAQAFEGFSASLQQQIQQNRIILENRTRNNRDQDDDRSVAGSRRVQRASSRTADRPSRPTFLREERAAEENVEDVEEPTFAYAYMADHDEWQLLTPEA